MNTFGLAIAWSAMQITLIGFLTAILYFGARRFGPRLAATTAFFGLSMMALTVILSFSPWPSWTVGIPSDFELGSSHNDETTESRTADHGVPANVSQVNWLSVVRQVWMAELAQSDTRAAQSATEFGTRRSMKRMEWRWSTIIAILFILAILIGAFRLLCGLVAARRYGQDSVVLDNGEVAETVDILKARLKCHVAVEVHEHATLTSAATIGWWRPIILLPPAWRSWQSRELKVVLAHELAHIHHCDFVSWVSAQAFVAVQFFHPLAHWLAARLRLEQELAADSVAADLAGGRDVYLASLADLALRQDNDRLSWSAQAFLPTRKSFLRRIEMLRDKRRGSDRGQRRLRPVVMGILLLFSAAIVGWRQPQIISIASPVSAAEDAEPSLVTTTNDADFSLAYVPRDAVGVAAIRPNRLLRRPEFAELRDILNEVKQQRNDMDIEQIEAARFLLLTSNRDGVTEPGGVGILLQFVGSESYSTAAFVEEVENFVDRTVSKTSNGMYATKVDDRTLLLANDLPTLRRMIIAGEEGPVNESWVDDWKPNARKDAVAVVNIARLKPILLSLEDRGSGKQSSFVETLRMIGPIWKDSRYAVMAAAMNESLTGEVQIATNDEKAADSVQNTLSALMTLGRNMLSNTRDTASRRGSKQDVAVMRLVDLSESIMDTLKIRKRNSRIVAELSASRSSVQKLAGAVTPAIVAAREAARRTQDINSAKQIMLAFLNYEAVNKRFPTAAMVGPDGKTVHSWRVAILPFLEQADLYDQYRLDEPWDSPHNKKMLAKMPNVFRSAQAPSDSTNSSFFVFTGKNSVFDGNKTLRMADITDGLSKTLFIVEAKRDVPWTKPEDIPFDPSKPLPKLSGHNQAGNIIGMGDGAVRFLSNDIDAETVKNLITPAGSETVDFNEP